MDLRNLIAALSDPAAYPEPVEQVEVRQTHISVVFLAGRHAYKIKKPLNLGFLDFSTLERRRRFCEEEVRLNRRLAPGIYLGVVPVASERGSPKMEGPGEAVEWAVKMERLPDDATLRARLRRGEVGTELLEDLARRIASFHARAERGDRVSAFGRFEVVARNARENFEQSAAHVEKTVSGPVFSRLQTLTEEALHRLRPLIEERAKRGMPRDTHGDLRLEHIYLLPGREPLIVDCIEFNERFRFADPVADIAFLAMDLAIEGRRDLARSFADAYFRACGDEEGRALLPFYVAYRGAVRGKVAGFKLSEKEVPDAEKVPTLAKARAHWLLALVVLEEPGRRPCLVLVGGLPGTGKSTLARGLAERAGFRVIRSDLVRKELAGLEETDRGTAAFGEGIYDTVWTDRTYGECLRRAERFLFEGNRVVVDASFREEKRRRAFLEAAVRFGVPGAFLLCRAEPGEVRVRLEKRSADASDADWSIYLKAAERWEEPSPLTRPSLREVPTGGGSKPALSRALDSLREMGLQG